MANAPEFDHTFCSGNPVTGRSVFISDLHLGTKGCRSELLLDFLSHLVIENLFLVGDIIDLERMQQTVHWPSSHTAVIQQILKMAASGTRVMYIPGNHDARIRAMAGAEVHGVQIRLNTIHETADGRRVLVTHGDQFDADLRIGGIKERLGGAAYQWLLEFDSSINKVRERFGYDKVSIASSVKMRLKSAQQYIRRYEQMALEHARKRGLDGIVCGHIHKPFCFEKDGIGYFNDGDWVEHCSALIEDTSGRLHSVRWSAATSERDSTAAQRAA